jgi:hypothetical protein
VFGRWGVLAAVAAVAVVLFATLATQNTSAGSAAIRATQDLVAGSLRDSEARLADRGESLSVTWSSTPSPAGGDSHLVVARLEVQPSGEEGQAQFAVVGGRVSSRNELADRLLPGRAVE